MSTKPQTLGGIIRGETQKKEALERYLNNPNYCKQCGLMIPPNQKFSHVRKKKFCDRKCSGLSRIKPDIKERKRFKSKDENLRNISKEQLFKTRKNWQSARTAIREHARWLFPKENLKKCSVCCYAKHVEICHIKSVSSFPPEALLGEINDPSNLVGLCPNCHWEFDNGLLTEAQLKMDAGVGFEPTKPDLMRVGSAPALPAS